MTLRVMSADCHDGPVPPSARRGVDDGDVDAARCFRANLASGGSTRRSSKDHHGVATMARIAPDNVMWGSDYPPRDGTWPFSGKVIEEQFGDVDEAIGRTMLRENVRRVYRIE